MSDHLNIRQQDEELGRKRQEEELELKLELESNKQQQRQIKQQLKELGKKHNDEKEEFEGQQHETEEEKRKRIEREVRELEEKFNLPHLPQQRHQPKSNSLFDQLADKQREHCGILISPMGINERDNESVPVVHPEMVISEHHFTERSVFTDGRYKPSKEGRNAHQYAPRISFNDVTKSIQTVETPESSFSVLLRKHNRLSLSFIGPAGCGKTTITKRMVKTWIEDHKVAFHIPFAEIDKDVRQSLKNLLITLLYRIHSLKHNQSEEEIDEAFQWILDNQDQCLLVLDGLDKSAFDISNQPIEDPEINGQFLPGDLVALLMSRRFLPNCRLVVTSRPHSLAQFAPAIQPNIVVFLNEFLRKDVEKLMNHYLVQRVASDIMQKLRIKSPRIYQLVLNPLFLKLVVMLYNEVGEDVWSYVNTTAKLFFEVIKKLQFTAHQESDSIDVEVLNNKLGEMAFEKTMKGSVVFTQEDLKHHGLIGENVQDFMYGVFSSTQNTELPVGLEMIFFFNDQVFQEFFSAKFAVERLAVHEFKKFVGKLFPRLEKNEDGEIVGVGADPFAILRVFVIGCVNEITQLQQTDGEEVLEKKAFFVKFLSNYIRQLFGNDNSGGGLQQSLTTRQMEELRLETEKIKQQQSMKSSKSQRNSTSSQVSVRSSKPHSIDLMMSRASQRPHESVSVDSSKPRSIDLMIPNAQPVDNPIQSRASQLPHESDIVKEHQKKLITDLLDLQDEAICNEIRESLKDVNFRFDYGQNSFLDVTNFGEVFCHFLQKFTSKVERLNLNIREWNNEDEIMNFMNKIHESPSKIESGSFWMLVLNGDGDQQQFCRKLKEKISYFDTSKLQTQVFVLKIRDVSIDFEVFLRWGEPPQFFTD